jgi:predicted phosphodiesterase
VCGHSHKPAVETREGVLYVNPGSAGPRRFKLPIAVGELLIDGDRIEARIIELETKITNGTAKTPRPPGNPGYRP